MLVSLYLCWLLTPTLEKSLLINAWAYRLLLSWLHQSSSCFPHTCINIPHWVHCHGDRLSSPALVKLLDHSCIVFHFVHSFRVEALFKQVTCRHAHLCWVWLKSEESECYKDLQDNDALSCESFELWTIDQTKMHPEGTTELFTLIEPVCKAKMLALCCTYRFL